MFQERIKTILILHHVSSLGGGTKSMIDMALMLKNKYRVILIVPSGSQEIKYIANKNNIEIYETKTPIPSLNLYSGMPGFCNRYFWSRIIRFRKNKELVTELMQFNPDAVFFNTSVTALIAKDLPKVVKKVCIVRETFIRTPLNSIIRNNFEKRFNGLAFIAQHEKDYIGVNGPLQIIVPDCLEPKSISSSNREETRKEYNIPIDAFCSLFMGGLIQIKGLDVLLKAAEILNDNHKVIVAGAIDRRVFSTKFLLTHLFHISYVRFLLSVKKRLDRLVDKGRVIETGYVDDISPWMTICDTVVFPSTAAHQPRPCIEAGNYERSCVLSDFDATKEYFIDGYNALTFRPKDSLDLAKKLNCLAQSSDLNNKLALNNRKMSHEKHDFATIQMSLNSFFDKILEV